MKYTKDTLIPKFWYESNAIWGNVETFGELAEKAHYQLKHPGGAFDTLDVFLDRSKSVKDPKLGENYGTRREHTGDKTLRQYLSEAGILEQFIEYFNENPIDKGY